MDVPVRLDLTRFVERSNGVFGKSGTGKSFLTRLLHCGIVTKRRRRQPDLRHAQRVRLRPARARRGYQVKGLQTAVRLRSPGLHPRSEVAGTANDGLIPIGLNEIEIEDIALLADELRLNTTAVESADLCDGAWATDWIAQLTDEDADALRRSPSASGRTPASLAALQRKLARRFGGSPFVATQRHRARLRAGSADRRARAAASTSCWSSGSSSNLLRLHAGRQRHHPPHPPRWTRAGRGAQAGQGQQAPPQLMITIEEAHKFLNPRAANQTIFGTIARELRKYNVTLLVVDQRPSGIDDEVLSQIGTRITCALNDDKDIEAVLAGVSGASHLRADPGQLDSRQQAMILGHAVPMPMALRTRAYDETFYDKSGVVGRGTAGAGRVEAGRAGRAPTTRFSGKDE